MVKIRLAKLIDCKFCANLSKIQELKLANGEFISINYFKNFLDKDNMFLVAEENNNIIGYALGEPMKGKVAHLGLLTVDNKFRNHGIGNQLVNKFEDQCKKKGIKNILLYAPKFNKKTLNFYKKLGFQKGKEHIQFLKG